MRPWLRCLPLSELIDRYRAWQDEPYGIDMDNFRFGQLCSVIANVHGNKSKPSDFYPQFGSEREQPASEQSAEHLLAMFRGVIKGMGN